MGFVDKCIERINKNVKIVLPEAEEKRVLLAALKTVEKTENIDIILVGEKEKIDEILKVEEEIKVKLEKYVESGRINVVIPTKGMAEKIYEKRKHKGITKEAAEKLSLDPVNYGMMLVDQKMAEGLVSGAIHSTADTLRPALQLIGTKEGSKMVSSFFIMELKNNLLPYTEYVFSDCGLVEDPTAEQLVEIAKSSKQSYENLVGEKARVALLSYSTIGSAKSEKVEKVQKAIQIIKEGDVPDKENYDGELQLDAAIIREIGKSKAPGSKVAGNANTLIFPDLNAGNIGYKLVQRFAGANAFGPVCQGLKYPVNDLSRGSTVEDIYGVIIITALQSLI